MSKRMMTLGSIVFVVAFGMFARLGADELERRADDPIRTFLVAGQSNTDGYGLGYGNLSYGYLDPPDDLYDIGRGDLVDPQAQVSIFHGAYYSGNGSWQTLEPGFGIQWNGIRFGPELSFGYDVQNQCGLDIRLIKYSVGGTSLAHDWDPDFTGTNQYDYFMTTVQNAIAAAGAAGETLDIIGLVWMQGESDALNYSMATAYETNLTHFIASVRQDLGLPDLDAYVGSIADSPVWTYRQIVWDAQDSVAAADPRVNVANGKDLPLFVNDGDGSANIHYTTQGEVTLGERFAASVMSSVAVSPDPLVAGQSGTFTLTRGRPNRYAFLGYSIDGPGSTWLPNLHVYAGLANPRHSRTATAGPEGEAEWTVPVPPAAAGLSIWIQVVQYEQISNVIATTIQ